MFFALSKILYFLMSPFWWIIILLLWSVFNKKRHVRKRLYIACIIILVVFTNPFLYRSAVMAWYTNDPKPVLGTVYDAGIVLGGMAGYDKNGNGHFGDNSDRFIQTANLYHQGIIRKIIVSGGTGKLMQDEPAESFFLRQQFLANGVNAGDIYIDSLSRNTYENAIFSKRITDSLHLRPPFILVTSAAHMRRSESVFRKAGFTFIGYPCDYKVTPQHFSIDDTILPNAGLLNRWTDLIKEWIGLYVYRFTGKA